MIPGIYCGGKKYGGQRFKIEDKYKLFLPDLLLKKELLPKQKVDIDKEILLPESKEEIYARGIRRYGEWGLIITANLFRNRCPYVSEDGFIFRKDKNKAIVLKLQEDDDYILPLDKDRNPDQTLIIGEGLLFITRLDKCNKIDFIAFGVPDGLEIWEGKTWNKIKQYVTIQAFVENYPAHFLSDVPSCFINIRDKKTIIATEKELLKDINKISKLNDTKENKRVFIAESLEKCILLLSYEELNKFLRQAKNWQELAESETIKPLDMHHLLPENFKIHEERDKIFIEFRKENCDGKPTLLEESDKKVTCKFVKRQGVYILDKKSEERDITKLLEELDKEKSELKEEEEKLEYAIFLSHSSGIGVIPTEDTEEGVREKYSNKKEKCDIFVYERTVYKKIGVRIKNKTKENIIPVDLDENVFRLLVIFLRYKDKPISTMALYHKAWEGSIEQREEAKHPAEIMEQLKQGVSQLRRAFGDVKGFEIPTARGRRSNTSVYYLRGNFSFCLIAKKSDIMKYTLSAD